MDSYKCCDPTTKESQVIDSLAGMLKIVAEESRLRLLCILRQKEHCVSELMEHVVMSQSLISHHLKDLKKAGIVTVEKRGLRVYYSLNSKGVKITKLLFSIPS